jgi:Fe2+ transport system protein FeoA
VLALLVGYALRRKELAELEIETIQRGGASVTIQHESLPGVRMNRLNLRHGLAC